MEKISTPYPSIQSVGKFKISFPHNKNIECILDTGSCSSIINERLATDLIENNVAQKVENFDKSIYNFRNADTTKIPIKSSIIAKFELNGTLVEYPFIVTKNLNVPILLGYDFLKKYNAKWDFCENSVRLENYDLTIFLDHPNEKISPIVGTETKTVSTTTPKKSISPTNSLSPISIYSDHTYDFEMKSDASSIISENLSEKHEDFCNDEIEIVQNINLLVPPQNNKSYCYNDFLDDDRCDLPPLNTDRNILKEIDTNKDLCPETKIKLDEILQKYSTVFSNDSNKIIGCNVAVHKIDTGDAQPISVPPRRTSFANMKEIDRQVDELLEAKIIRPSQSEWASPIVLVSKKSGEKRICIDYRPLNAVTKDSKYPLPYIEDAISMLSGSQYFSTLDLKSGYFQIKMDEQSKDKTAFVCHRGQFTFENMSFGLKNASQTFQAVMNKVLAGLTYVCCMVFQDDILIYSPNKEQHLLDIASVLQRLKDADLICNAKKCHFFKTEQEYLGHIVSSKGIATNPDKISKVRNFPKPTDRTTTKSFLGLCSYYRRFIKNFAKIANPLTELTKTSVKFKWSPDAQKSFETLKQKLIESPVLAYPDPKKQYILQTDASFFCIGGILSQRDKNGYDHPIAYMSKTLSKTQQNYDIREKEALACILAVEKYRPYIEGTHFIIQTDHKNLKWLFKNAVSGRLGRWALRLMEFQPFTVEHKPGKSNTNADVLSRIPIKSQDNNINNISVVELPSVKQLVELQKSDILLGPIYKYFENNSQKTNHIKDFLKVSGKYCIDPSDKLLKFSRNNGPLKIEVPQKLKIILLRIFHEFPLSGHFGRDKTLQKISAEYHWQGLKNEVDNYISGCILCKRKKGQDPKIHGKLKLFPDLEPFSTCSIDIAGPFPTSYDNYKYVLSIIDRFSKYVEIEPLKGVSANEVADVFFNKYICSHGCPQKLLSDLGANFLSKLFSRLCERLKIKRLHTVAYKPSTNSNIERMHRTMSESISCFVNENKTDWTKYLYSFKFAYNTSYVNAIKSTPFEIVYGKKANFPYSILNKNNKNIDNDIQKYKMDHIKKLKKVVKNVKSARRDYNKNMKKYHDRKHIDPKFKVGELVLVKSPTAILKKVGKLDPKYQTLFRIIKKHSPLNFSIENLNTGRILKVHVERIIRYIPYTTKYNGYSSMIKITDHKKENRKTFYQIKVGNVKFWDVPENISKHLINEYKRKR